MIPTGGATLDRLRHALLVLVAGSVALFALSSTTSAPSVVLLAAAAAAVLALVAASHVVVTPLTGGRALSGGPADDVPALRAGHVTDSPHHPLRPRAPGLV